jgi:NitT/TauT family transport system substrate-binding protein
MMGTHHLRLVRLPFAALAMLTLLAAPAVAQTKIRFALDGPLNGVHAPFALAEDRGFYKAEGLEVALDPSAAQTTAAAPASAASPDALSRVANGAADMALADINALVRLREQNPAPPLKAVFIFTNKPAYAVIARKSRGITAPKDLEGKRIGAPPNEMASALWPVFAKLNEIDKVKIETVAAAVRDPMLAAGQIDAVTGTSFMTFINLKARGVPVDDLVVLEMAEHGLPLYGDAIIVNTAFANEHPAAVKGFLRAYAKALRESIRSPGRAVDSLMKLNGSAKKEIELERLRMAINDNIVTEEVQANGLGGIDAARFASGLELLAQTFKLKAKPEASDIFDDTFLPPAAERRLGTARPG